MNLRKKKRKVNKLPIPVEINKPLVIDIIKTKYAKPTAFSKTKNKIYIYGEKLGNQGSIYLHDIIDNQKCKPRKAYFICGQCGKMYIAPIKKVKAGHVCTQCGHVNTGLKKKKNLHPGDILNQGGSIFIKDLGIHGYYHYALVECGYCHSIYKADIHKVINSNHMCCACKSQRAALARRKYNPGDILTASNGNIFLFAKEIHTDSYGRKGQFVLLDSNYKQCGKPFVAMLASVLHGNANGKAMSIGESNFNNALQRLHLNFDTQYSFSDLVGDYGTKLRFDFAVFIQNKIICVELDGIQHFQPVNRFGGKESFIRNKRYDTLKNEYCSKHNIPLIRIPYTEYNKINAEYVDNLMKGVLDNR